MKAKQKITQTEVSAALQQFINQGGIISQLPDQEFRMAQMVGDDKYDIYEHLSDLSSIASSEEPPRN